MRKSVAGGVQGEHSLTRYACIKMSSCNNTVNVHNEKLLKHIGNYYTSEHKTRTKVCKTSWFLADSIHLTVHSILP